MLSQPYKSYTYLNYNESSWSCYRSTRAKEILNERDIQILDIIYENLYDPQYTDDQLEYILFYYPKTEVNRLINWLECLSKVKKISCLIFNRFYEAILWSFKTRRIITSQTQYQFEISKSFLEQTISLNIPIENKTSSRIFFTIILILGIRPELQVRPLKKNIEYNLIQEDYVDYYEHLFFAKPTLNFLVPHIHHLNMEEFQVLLNITNGSSLRHQLPKHLSISKTENKLLHQIQFSLLQCRDNFIERYILAIRVLKVSPGYLNLLLKILEVSKIFREQLDTFRNDICFWQDIYRFIISSKDSLVDDSNITGIIDYFEYKRYYTDKPYKYSLKKRTTRSVQRQIETWHREQQFHDPQFINASWRSSGISPWIHIGKVNDSYIVEEITSGKRLLEEGNVLNHCVFSYISSCINGFATIYSLSKIEENVKIPLYTIEIRHSTIQQIAGAYNKKPAKPILNIINEWAKEHQIKNNKY